MYMTTDAMFHYEPRIEMRISGQGTCEVLGLKQDQQIVSLYVTQAQLRGLYDIIGERLNQIDLLEQAKMVVCVRCGDEFDRKDTVADLYVEGQRACKACASEQGAVDD